MIRKALTGILLMTLPVAAAADEDLVRIPDANLRAAVYEARKQSPPDGETAPLEILTGLYVLDAQGREIADLTGLEHCINLSEARLARNRIRDVAPLAQCRNLQSLDLAHNRIPDASPLGTLIKLQYLRIEHNELESLGGLETLEALNSLYAGHNRIESIEPVVALKRLWSLNLDHNRIIDISPAASLPRIDNLGLAHNRIEDVSKLPPGNGMYATYLQGNCIADIGPLVALAERDANGRFAAFWRLYLADNPLNEESRSVHLPALRKLGVRLDLEYDR